MQIVPNAGAQLVSLGKNIAQGKILPAAGNLHVDSARKVGYSDGGRRLVRLKEQRIPFGIFQAP